MVGKKQIPSPTDSRPLLVEWVPEQNIYRRLKHTLDLRFLYSAVAPYYGSCGHTSIDPLVFFKLMLVGHLENLVSDRAIVRHCQLRIDILYFLDYELGEALPWHSTLSRTRQRLPIPLFELCFQYILAQCAQAGLIDGHIQAVDSAYVEANASLANVEPRNLADWTIGLNPNSPQPSPEMRGLNAVKPYVNPHMVSRNNRTHQSPTDAQARLAIKPGKPFRFYYLASIVVDTARHVITHIQADAADEKDSRHLVPLVDKAALNLRPLGLPLQQVLADAAFSSGDNCAALEQRGIEAFVSLYGRYKPVREAFTYDAREDVYRCWQGAVLANQGIRMRAGYGNYTDMSKASVCKGCPIKAQCCGDKRYKRLTFTMYRNPYERMRQRVESVRGKQMKKLRSSTVEPVLGSLLNYFGMRRSNARGQGAAHKRMLMAATAYNLKKWLLNKDWPKAVTQALVLDSQRLFCLSSWGIHRVGSLAKALCNSHDRLNENYLLLVSS